MANFPFNDDGTLASTIGEHGARVPTQAALDGLEALLGGGGLTVDNGTDPPAVVSTLFAPGASLSGSSATLICLTRLSADFAVTDAGLVNPEDNGVAAIDIPSGSMFHAFALQTTTFNGLSEVDLAAAETPTGSALPLVSYQHVGTIAVESFGSLEPNFNVGADDQASVLATSLSKWALATADLHIYVAIYPDALQTLTVGALRVYALIATPVA
jgi:hypothetical protein